MRIHEIITEVTRRGFLGALGGAGAAAGIGYLATRDPKQTTVTEPVSTQQIQPPTQTQPKPQPQTKTQTRPTTPNTAPDERPKFDTRLHRKPLIEQFIAAILESYKKRGKKPTRAAVLNDVANMLGNAEIETNRWTSSTEGFVYSSAENILKTFGQQFQRELYPIPHPPQYYIGKPVELANEVYGGRFGNDPPWSGDGWRYRGRGYLHLTFKENYQNANPAWVNQPDIVSSDPQSGITSAINYYLKRVGLNSSPQRSIRIIANNKHYPERMAAIKKWSNVEYLNKTLGINFDGLISSILPQTQPKPQPKPQPKITPKPQPQKK